MSASPPHPAPPGSPPDLDDRLRALVEGNPGQGSLAEYRAIAGVILARRPCNLLVFGVGRDSALWIDLNVGGRTAFIEHEPEWIAETRRRLPAAEVVQVRYRTRARWWRLYLLRPARLWMDDLPPAITATAWDVVFVDSPQGYRPHTPGRMKSIYSAARLAAPGADVLVHDTDRRIERVYADRFLGEPALVTEVGKLRGYRRPR